MADEQDDAQGAGDIWDTDDAWASDSVLGRDVANIERLTIGAVAKTAGDPDQAWTWRCPEWPRAERAVNAYLRQLRSNDASPSTLRSYAYDLQRWLRLLRAIDVEFDQATRSDYHDFKRFLDHHGKTHGARRPRRKGFQQRNRKTGKIHAHDKDFSLTSIQHSRSVLHEWYEFLYDTNGKPLVNPIPHSENRDKAGARRNAHHNPLQEFETKRTRLRDGGKQAPERAPRHMPDDAFDEFWNELNCHRDRALVQVQVDSAIRPEELLTLMASGIDWGTPTVTIVRKGTRAEQTVPVTAEAVLWLRRYFQEQDYFPTGDDLVWITRRRPFRPLEYDAYRAVMNKVNERLGTDWTPHDLRHTGLVRMLDGGMPKRYVQEIAGHSDEKTLTRYTRPRLAEIVEAQQAARSRPKPTVTPSEYNPDDLKALFGDGS